MNDFLGGGASQIPCTDTFAGIHAFSEPESKALDDFYATMHDRIKIYLSFHSAAEMILFPMGHVGTFEEVPNVDDLVNLKS
jgi:carboxypeptidase A